MVEPDGIRRYAMTSRTINFDHYREPKQRAELAQRGLTMEEVEEAAELPDSGDRPPDLHLYSQKFAQTLHKTEWRERWKPQAGAKAGRSGQPYKPRAVAA